MKAQPQVAVTVERKPLLTKHGIFKGSVASADTATETQHDHDNV
jgi:hypothetical protein